MSTEENFDDVDEVDLTPMIDVIFLLLIFHGSTMLKQPEAELSIQLESRKVVMSLLWIC